MNDPELKALDAITTAMAKLTEDQARNVLLYVNSRYGQSVPRGAVPPGMPASSLGHAEGDESAYADIGDFFDAADPQTQAERVLVVAYWMQVIEESDDFEAFPVNKHLKHLGHPVSNITRALDSLISQSPRLVMQTVKRGSAKQARKRYKITRAGTKSVQAMIDQE